MFPTCKNPMDRVLSGERRRRRAATLLIVACAIAVAGCIAASPSAMRRHREAESGASSGDNDAGKRSEAKAAPKPYPNESVYEFPGDTVEGDLLKPGSSREPVGASGHPAEPSTAMADAQQREADAWRAEADARRAEDAARHEEMARALEGAKSSMLPGFMGGGGGGSSGGGWDGGGSRSDIAYDVIGDAESPSKFNVLRVFYGTDRSVTRGADPVRNSEEYYAAGSGRLQLGYCDVSVPKRHKVGEVERPSVWRLEFDEHPDRHIILKGIHPLDHDLFVSELQSEVDRSGAGETFIFVHGFNVTFAEAARRTAQMTYDLKFDGPPIMYSWPSRGDLVDYVADMTAAQRAEPNLLAFVELVACESQARKIHLIAHSMGNQVVTAVLDRLAERGDRAPRFNEIILAAPDVDALIFKRDIAPRMAAMADRVTVYASENDKALMASERLNGGRRLGQGGPDLVVIPEVPDVDMIDASALDFAFFDLGHSAYADKLLGDIDLTLAGLPAKERGLAPHQDRQPAWKLPEHVSLADAGQFDTPVHPASAGNLTADPDASGIDEPLDDPPPAPRPTGWLARIRSWFASWLK